MVLYEDLKIESTCATASEGIPPAESLGERYRRLYFLRRSFLTLEEFDTAFHQVNMEGFFKKALRGWSHEHRNQWAYMIKFFAKNRQLLKDIRNAIGGHFSNEAAKRALEELGHDDVARLEILGPTGSVKFHMAEGPCR